VRVDNTGGPQVRKKRSDETGTGWEKKKGQGKNKKKQRRYRKKGRGGFVGKITSVQWGKEEARRVELGRRRVLRDWGGQAIKGSTNPWSWDKTSSEPFSHNARGRGPWFGGLPGRPPGGLTGIGLGQDE